MDRRRTSLTIRTAQEWRGAFQEVSSFLSLDGHLSGMSRCGIHMRQGWMRGPPGALSVPRSKDPMTNSFNIDFLRTHPR